MKTGRHKANYKFFYRMRICSKCGKIYYTHFKNSSGACLECKPPLATRSYFSHFPTYLKMNEYDKQFLKNLNYFNNRFSIDDKGYIIKN